MEKILNLIVAILTLMPAICLNNQVLKSKEVEFPDKFENDILLYLTSNYRSHYLLKNQNVVNSNQNQTVRRLQLPQTKMHILSGKS